MVSFKIRRSYARWSCWGLALCVALLLGACGGGGDDDAPPTNPPPGGTNPNPVTKGPVTLNWTPPSKRANGNDLDITELGGYEIRYRRATAENYTFVVIRDAWTTTHYIAWLEGQHEFEIAAFDDQGLYSNFVPLTAE